MSVINENDPKDTIEITETPDIGGLTEEEIAAMEEERRAKYEAKLAPYAALKERMDTTTAELTDLQMALVEFYEQLLNP